MGTDDLFQFVINHDFGGESLASAASAAGLQLPQQVNAERNKNNTLDTWKLSIPAMSLHRPLGWLPVREDSCSTERKTLQLFNQQKAYLQKLHELRGPHKRERIFSAEIQEEKIRRV